MLVNELTMIRENVQRTASYLIGNHRITPAQKADHGSLCNGLTLWAGILLDTNSILESVSSQECSGRRSRIIKMGLFRGCSQVNLTEYLVFLDDIDAWLLNLLSTSTRFKGELPHGITVPAEAGIVLSLVRDICHCTRRGEMLDGEAVRMIHQICSFLQKIELDRPDLVKEANAQFISFEQDLSTRMPLRSNPFVARVLDEMNLLARKHLATWTPAPFRPRHGPGAVADKSVKVWYEKYLTMRTDLRIAYLLGRSSLGTERDYCPWIKSEKSTRTSRFISVPKTWKKLRGISAEPVELQFYQQALRRSIDTVFTSQKWWRDRVNLHDQSISAKYALNGSITGSYATIDLSAASDSVTLELVKEVFKGTSLLYWLLGTRCTHTICDEQVIRIRKFAPMGSATCFPVECIVFALAAQVASDRTYVSSIHNRGTVRVFGDDIVTDYFSVDALLEILGSLGFKVNTRKTFHTGCFREACGTEAYRGVEIQPLRYKRLGGNLNTWTPQVGDISAAISYSNKLFENGYRLTRAYLISALLHSKVKIGKRCVPVGPYITATFSGMRGSLASPQPTNFNRLLKFDSKPNKSQKVPWYQTTLVRNLGVRVRFPSYVEGSEMSELFSWQKYHEWQLEHQQGLVDYEKMWEEGWIDLGALSAVDQRIPLGSVTVPAVKWVPWTYTDTLV